MWGIIITINGKLTHKKIDTNMVIGNLYVDISNVEYLSVTEKEFIVKGIKWIYSYSKIKEATTLTITKLVLNPCDYQAEGLFFAIANWLSKELNFEMPKYEYYFDSLNNKYVFPLLK